MGLQSLGSRRVGHGRVTEHVQVERESKEEWIYVYIWLIQFAVEQTPTQHYKANMLQQIRKRTRFPFADFLYYISISLV